jgi:hypothetical protein
MGSPYQGLLLHAGGLKSEHVYRGVDKAGQTVDFFLSRNRDVNPAQIVSAQRDEEHARSHEDHVRCLTRTPPYSGFRLGSPEQRRPRIVYLPEAQF